MNFVYYTPCIFFFLCGKVLLGLSDMSDRFFYSSWFPYALGPNPPTGGNERRGVKTL